MKKGIKGEMSFLEHLEELRWHIIRSVVVMIIFAIVAFIYKNILFDKIILGPQNPSFWTNRMFCKLSEFIKAFKLCINSKPHHFQNIYLAGQFTAHVKISLIAGLIASFPYIFYEFWRFVKPALYSNEKKYTTGAILFITLLFIMGVLFGYYIVCPLSVNFLISYQISSTIANQILLMSYVSTITSITFASGLLFELPAVIYFLSKIGLVTPSFLKKYRRHAIIIVLTIAAIITPSPDVISQILVSLPLLLLYEVSIILSKRVQKKRQELPAG